MEPHPDDLTAANDLTLVESARAGDRLSFGVLYLRHHAAAWRVACVVSRFSPDAELAVIEGFTRVFSALPRKSEDFAAGAVMFRPYLLACVRQAALERARSAGRTKDTPAPLAGLAADGDLMLSSVEHHVARGALATLPERARTALWLSDVEAMTPAEIATIIGGRPLEITALVGRTRSELRAASQATLVGHEVRSACRFTVANLESYRAGTLDPAKGVLVRSHLDLCPTCRMRIAELGNAPAALAAAVPAAPLLGGEAQHHFLASLADVHPAHRLLPPGIAAVAPTVLPAPARRVAAVAAAAAGLPELALQAGRRARPAVPVLSLVAAWLGVMLALPQLMEPDTAPGPGGMALPAVQAYIPDYMPGRSTTSSTGNAAGALLSPGNDAGSGAGTVTELASPPGTIALPAAPPSPAVQFVATAASRRSPTGRAVPAAPATSITIPVVPAVTAVAPLTVATSVPPAIPAVLPAVTAALNPSVISTATAAKTPDGTDKRSRAVTELQRRLERKLRSEAPSISKSARPDITSLRSKVREETDGRAARRETRRRNTDHAQSA